VPACHRLPRGRTRPFIADCQVSQNIANATLEVDAEVDFDDDEIRAAAAYAW
jgi:hypothetical protein